MIEQVNCGIFRHGVDNKTNVQIPPHLDKVSCDKLFAEGRLYGCGKPFKLVLNPEFDPTITHVGPKDKENPKYIAEVCEYI